MRFWDILWVIALVYIVFQAIEHARFEDSVRTCYEKGAITIVNPTWSACVVNKGDYEIVN